MSEPPVKQSKERESEEKEKDFITALKVVEIMQVISEDLGDKEKKMWQKMLGTNNESQDDSGSK